MGALCCGGATRAAEPDARVDTDTRPTDKSARPRRAEGTQPHHRGEHRGAGGYAGWRSGGGKHGAGGGKSYAQAAAVGASGTTVDAQVHARAEAVLHVPAAAASLTASTLDPRWQTISGVLVNVADGDTCVVAGPDRSSHRIRLAFVDAPESAQKFGEQARNALRDKALRQRVVVHVVTQDQYQRIVGVLVLESTGEDLNLWLLQHGNAWYYDYYARRDQPLAAQRIYSAAMQAAREARIGLWADPAPQNPREWRLQHPRTS